MDVDVSEDIAQRPMLTARRKTMRLKAPVSSSPVPSSPVPSPVPTMSQELTDEYIDVAPASDSKAMSGGEDSSTRPLIKKIKRDTEKVDSNYETDVDSCDLMKQEFVFELDGVKFTTIKTDYMAFIDDSRYELYFDLIKLNDKNKSYKEHFEDIEHVLTESGNEKFIKLIKKYILFNLESDSPMEAGGGILYDFLNNHKDYNEILKLIEERKKELTIENKEKAKKTKEKWNKFSTVVYKAMLVRKFINKWKQKSINSEIVQKLYRLNEEISNGKNKFDTELNKLVLTYKEIEKEEAETRQSKWGKVRNALNAMKKFRSTKKKGGKRNKKTRQHRKKTRKNRTLKKKRGKGKRTRRN